MRRIILDCDPGVDDALALLLALAAPDQVEVLGVTCVHGNVALDQTVRNAARVLAAAGRPDIPVHAGRDRPLVAPRHPGATSHGADGLCGAAFPEPGPISPRPAADFIRDTVHRFPGEVTLCAIGPMTNIAAALQADPTLAPDLAGIAFMGGAAFRPGNMTDAAEFNFLLDPHAAAITLAAPVPKVMFGLDVTLQVVVTPVHVRRLQGSGALCSGLAATMLARYAKGDCHLHDPCVVAWLIEPALFSGLRAEVRVVTDSGDSYGRSLATPDPAGSCTVITGVDSDRLFDLLQARLARLP